MTNRSVAPKAKILKMPSQKDNFGFTKSEFDVFALNVRNGDETLFLTIFNEHLKDSVIYLINKFTIPHDLAYDVCMDTLLDFRIKLINDKIQYGNLRFLFTRMAVNNFIDGAKKNKKVNQAINVFLGENASHDVDQEDFFIQLEQKVSLLDDSSKQLLNDIYHCGKNAEQIAEEHKISNSTFRKRKQRILEKLKKSFNKQDEKL